jgi:hypothetical protein
MAAREYDTQDHCAREDIPQSHRESQDIQKVEDQDRREAPRIPGTFELPPAMLLPPITGTAIELRRYSWSRRCE